MALTKAKASNILLTTPAASSNDVTPATTEYVTTALANMVDSAPSTLNTLNELAAALGDDANFSTTVTNSIATKLPLAGGTMTGNIAHASDFTIDAGGNITLNAAGDIILDADGDDWKFHEGGTAVFEIKHESHGVDFLLNTGNEDWRFKGSDDGTTITALHLDMSDAGKAIFNSDLTIGNAAGSNQTLQVTNDNGNFQLQKYSDDVYLNLNDNGSIIFRHYGSSGSSVSQIMSILPSGNVGIGTSTPSRPLEVSGSGDTLVRITGGSANAKGIEFYKGSGTATQLYNVSDDLRVFTNAAERMRIDSSGHLALKTTDLGYPDYGDDLTIADSGHCGMTIRSGTSSNGTLYFSDDTGTAVGTYAGKIAYEHASNTMLLATNGTNRIAIDSNGHVGIGTTSPNVHSGTGLVIHATSGGTGSTGSPRLRFTNTTTGQAATDGAELSLDGNTKDFYIENREGEDIIFYSGSERMRIRNTGTMYLSDPDSGNYVASFTSQVKANAINVGPYATFGTDYSGWGSCLGWNVRPKIGTTNSGFEAATGYYAAGASMVRMAGNTFGVTTWTASEIAQSNIGAGTTFISLAASGATTLGQNSGNLTDNYALKVQTSHGLGEQGSHNSSYFHHNTDRPYYYFSNACYASGGFHTYSDEKLKKNITTISGALDDVAKMNGVTFNWKDPETRGSGKTGKQFGVIAQNMLEVDSELPLLENDPLSPEETIETDESYYSMDYSRITPFLIEAIKELKEKLETAEARITELEG
jgi:hypothetical protein